MIDLDMNFPSQSTLNIATKMIVFDLTYGK